MDNANYENDFMDESNDEMTFVEYIRQNDQSYINEYHDYCGQNGLDPEDEQSAMSFIEYYEDELDANMEN